MPFRSYPDHAPAPRIRRVTRDGALGFGAPSRVLVAHRTDEVIGVLEEVEREAAAGRVAVGFIGYDAAPAFDPALVAHRNESLPLAWFSIYSSAIHEKLVVSAPEAPALVWRSDILAP